MSSLRGSFVSNQISFPLQFHNLLWLEELQHCVDVRQFDMERVQLDPARHSPGEIPKEFVLKVTYTTDCMP